MMEEQQSPLAIQQMPLEILVFIFNYLSANQLASLSRVSTQFQQVSSESLLQLALAGSTEEEKKEKKEEYKHKDNILLAAKMSKYCKSAAFENEIQQIKKNGWDLNAAIDTFKNPLSTFRKALIIFYSKKNIKSGIFSGLSIQAADAPVMFLLEKIEQETNACYIPHNSKTPPDCHVQYTDDKLEQIILPVRGANEAALLKHCLTDMLKKLWEPLENISAIDRYTVKINLIPLRRYWLMNVDEHILLKSIEPIFKEKSPKINFKNIRAIRKIITNIDTLMKDGKFSSDTSLEVIRKHHANFIEAIRNSEKKAIAEAFIYQKKPEKAASNISISTFFRLESELSKKYSKMNNTLKSLFEKTPLDDFQATVFNSKNDILSKNKNLDIESFVELTK
jgi:hypothetical protein